MSNPFEFFDLITCINLRSRPDRWEESKKEFEPLGLLDYVIRFDAIKNENPCYGNHLSHAKIFELAIINDFSNVLILNNIISSFL